LPDRLFELPVYSEGNVSDPLMYQIPIVARNIISGIPRLEKVGDILYHIYENMDGTGFPDKLQSWQIPLESRILRVAFLGGLLSYWYPETYEINRALPNFDLY